MPSPEPCTRPRAHTHSCLYAGTIRHRRFAPEPREFTYRMCLAYVDLAELPQLFDRYWLWSSRGPNLAWFRRSDYLGDPGTALDPAVRDRVQQELGRRPGGPIRLLTHLRIAGFNFNPVSFYYVFANANDAHPDAIVAEITNTPWGERHSYVLDCRVHDGGRRVFRWQFAKRFHVSPFLPMQMGYDWWFTSPGRHLSVHMVNRTTEQPAPVFDATLTLKRHDITAVSLAWSLAAWPLAPLRVFAAIYWQALKIWWRRIPFFPHPRKATAAASSGASTR